MELVKKPNVRRGVPNDGRDSDPAHRKDRSNKWNWDFPRKRLVSSAKARAKKKGIDFNITVEDVEIPESCPMLNIPLVKGKGRFSDNSPTLDRIDNNKGYIKGNIQVISYRANSIKRDASIEEFRSILEYWEKIDAST